MHAVFRQRSYADLVKVALIATVVCGCHVESAAPVTAGPSTTQSESDPTEATAGKKNSSSQSAATNAASSEAAKTAQTASELISDAKLARNPPGEVVSDRWMVNSIDGRWAGWTHLVETKLESDGQSQIHTQTESELFVNRFGEEHSQRLLIHTAATADGEMIGSRLILPGTTVEVEPRAGNWIANITAAGNTSTKQLAIQGKHDDANAPERSLAEKPLVPGERRTIRHFVPTTNQLGETRYVAEDLEEVAFPGGSERLLKVTAQLVMPDGTQDSTNWCDETGKIRKTWIAGLRLESLETSAEVALRKPHGELYDLGLATIVKVDRDLSGTQNASRFVFKAKLKETAIDGLFVSDASQQVEAIGKREARITILRVRPDEPTTLLADSKSPSDADSAAGSVIQSDDPRIQAFAGSIARGESDPWKIAVTAETAVREWIDKRDYSQAFASAADVLENRTGDCTEHAALLAAVCRARGIPARVAAGLVYLPQSQGFAYHMWNEVWIADRWVPLDATRPSGGVGVDHVKLIVTNLNDTDPMAAMLPVINVIGQLEIEVESVEP